MSILFVDLIAVISANLFNILLAAIMLSRVRQNPKLENRFGLFSIGLILPLILCMIINLINARPWWTVFLPGLLTLFLGIEYLLDYQLKLNFRETRWLGPYLLIFYLAQWGMIGYGFGVQPVYGYATLFTYFISLGSTAYSYSKVRHGK